MGILMMPVYGSMTSTPNLEVDVDTDDNVDFTVEGPAQGVVLNTADDSITIETQGVYTVTFSTVALIFNNAESTDLTFNISINGSSVTLSQVRSSPFGEDSPEDSIRTTISRVDHFFLNEGDVIRVLCTSATDNAFYVNASLTVTKVGF
ncbi:hypothetical protein [Alteribacter keqinensis]|uniref:C1q domain-containing protein n=1 Tax=Alteribacter keqinensis TaxID=2483800 RepID=A0A3M7TYA7_9BACI|nr:hypothetical protein [Alteribacter keqinensis]RNA69892.1 hypothetical protein EBO34_08155 [Alteribacter keqinensis]